MSRPFARSLLLSALLFPAFAAVAADQDRSSGSNPVKGNDDGSFVLPQIILGTQKQPVYPPAALDARFSGNVLLEMTVLTDGTVGKVKVIECSRPKVGFEDAAVRAVKQWRFDPGMENDEPIEVVTRLKLNFNRVGIGIAANEGQVSAGTFTVSNDSATSATSSAPGSSGSK